MSSYLGFQPTVSPNYFFISYNNEDADRVGAVTQRMAAKGVDLWYDHGIDYGDDWETVITERIHHSQAIVLFFTEGILRKKNSYVQKEYKIATRLYHKKVYVVLLDRINEAEIPDEKAAWWMDINEKQCITGFSYTDIDRLASDIIGALNGESRQGVVPPPKVTAQPENKPKRRGGCGKAILAFLLAVVLLLGTAAGAFAASPALRERVPVIEELFETLFPNAPGITPSDQNTSSEDTTDEPSEDTTEEPAEETTDAPSEGTTDEPAEDTTDAPSEDTTDIPSEDTTDEPSEDTTDASSEDTTDAPSEDTTDTSAEETTDESDEEQTTAPHEHHVVVDAAIAPTCTQVGKSEGKHCSDCGEVLVAQTTLPAKGHSFDDWYETLAPTESQKGEKRRDCTECDEYEIEAIAELAHNHDAWEQIVLEAVAPTCTQTGLTEGKKCSGCGETTLAQHRVSALGHTEVVDEAIEPTCTQVGKTQGKHCSVCDQILLAQNEIDALGHTETIEPAIAATCTETGLTEGKYCAVCEEVLIVQTVTSALGHTEVVDAAVAATCTTSGLTEGSHCSVCDEVLAAQIVLPAKGHTTVNDAAVEPTCTETGLAKGKHCSTCQAVIEEQQIVPAKGHTVSSWTEKTTDKHSGTCKVCNTVISEVHSMSGGKCEICGYVKQTDGPADDGDSVERSIHFAFDELCMYANGILLGRAFAPGHGHTSGWNSVAHVSDNRVDELYLSGWSGYVDAESCMFGYSIGGAAPVYLDEFTREAEDAVLSAAQFYGADSAHRMIITIPVGDMLGEYTISLYAKYPDGKQETLYTFTMVKTVTCPEQSEELPLFWINAEQLYAGAASNLAKNIEGAELRADGKYLALSSIGGKSAFDVIPVGSHVKAGRYLVIKYRIEADAQAEMQAGTREKLPIEYISDGEWHLAIVDLAQAGVLQDDDGNYIITALSFTCLDHDDAVCMDIGYMASFASVEAAEAYDAALGYDSISKDNTPPEKLTHMGLSFMLNSDGQSYSISGLGICTERVLILPSTYMGKPVTGIIGRAFWKLDYIVHVTFPESITYIEQDAFAYCNNLRSVTISSNMKEIGNWVFFGSGNLTDVYYTGTEAQWQEVYLGNSCFTSDYTVHYNAAITDPEDVQLPPEVTPPEYTDRFVVDMNVAENQEVYMPHFAAAGIFNPVCLLGYGNTVYLGNLDLSNYSKVLIYYSCDGSQITADAFAAASSLDIGLKSENSSFGEETFNNYDGALAYTQMVFSSNAWAGEGVRVAEIDLSDITYAGDVWAAVHNPQSTQICIHGVEFMY
ncbi:MAG: TIR domain-containing protein [Clostridia bacterium]|nr:TIR domain-containing protein [Clostridia bacterium]